MKVLNLVHPNNSEIKYKVQKFPDGQHNVVVYKDGLMSWLKMLDNGIIIKSRLNNFNDLELIACTVASLRECDVKQVHLEIPYFLGSRSDRKFEAGGNNYLKDVICPIINSLNLDSVTVLDPHSDCLEMGLKRFRKQDNMELVKFFLTINKYPTNFMLASPDAGALKKIYNVADNIDYKKGIIKGNKHRVDGKILETGISYPKDYDKAADILIIDDICDGGATFIEMAKILKADGHQGKIILLVTHGIFSKGLFDLSKHFDQIYCTNSYKDLMAIEHTNHGKVKIEEFVKQLNVF